jgi:hypothetical protein
MENAQGREDANAKFLSSPKSPKSRHSLNPPLVERKDEKKQAVHGQFAPRQTEPDRI